MKKLKKYGLALLISVLLVVILDVICIILDVSADFFVGWCASAAFMYTYYTYDENESDAIICEDENKIHTLEEENKSLKDETEKLKTDRDYYKSRFENLKSDNIVNDSIK